MRCVKCTRCGQCKSIKQPAELKGGKPVTFCLLSERGLYESYIAYANSLWHEVYV